MKLPILYKKTSTGAINQWEIETCDNKIITTYGLVGGKLQSVEESVGSKNLGRSNETTPSEQAESQAQSSWDAKIKTNHYLTIEEAQSQDFKTSKIGAYLPSLAKKWEEHGHKIKFPCLIQRKYDGQRMISVKEDDEVRLFSRTGKLISTLSHINEELNLIMKNGEIWDGEAYASDEDFNDSIGAIRADVNTNLEMVSKIKYWIYDCPRIGSFNETDSFRKRNLELADRIKNCENLVYVETYVVHNEDKIKKFHKQFTNEGYEGAIVRAYDMPYEQKRTDKLLKYKTFQDEEFLCIGYVEGTASKKGMVGSFILQDSRITKEDKTFKAGVIGSEEYATDLFHHPEKFMNKMMTVEFFSKSKYGVPRFPKCKTVRDYD